MKEKMDEINISVEVEERDRATEGRSTLKEKFV